MEKLIFLFASIVSIAAKEWTTFKGGPVLSLDFDQAAQVFIIGVRNLTKNQAFAVVLSNKLEKSDLWAFKSTEVGEISDMWIESLGQQPATDFLQSLLNKKISKSANGTLYDFLAHRKADPRDPFRDIIVGCGDTVTWTWLANTITTDLQNFDQKGTITFSTDQSCKIEDQVYQPSPQWQKQETKQEQLSAIRLAISFSVFSVVAIFN